MNRVFINSEGHLQGDWEKPEQVRPQAYKANREYFQDQAEMIATMQDERYKNGDRDFQALVHRMIQNTEAQGIDLGLRTEPETASNFEMDTNAETIDEQREFVVKLFSDERYKTSPTYRRMVAEFIAKHPDSNQFMSDPGSLQRVTVQSSDITGPMEPAPAVEDGDESSDE